MAKPERGTAAANLSRPAPSSRQSSRQAMPLDPLPADALRRRCTMAAVAAALAAPRVSDEVVGHERAQGALALGLALRHPGYNIFVLGQAGSGRHALVRQLLAAKAAGQPVPDDWCYVNNFTDANVPQLLRFPAGRGAPFQRAMQAFAAELPSILASAFQSNEYRARIDAIDDQFKRRERAGLERLEAAAKADRMTLAETPEGWHFAPKQGRRLLSPEAYDALPAASRRKIDHAAARLEKQLDELQENVAGWRAEMHASIRTAGQDVTRRAVGHAIAQLKSAYADLPAVAVFLEQVLDDISAAGRELRERTEGDTATIELSSSISPNRYEANLLVDHHAASGAPVIFADHPTFAGLVGHVDHLVQMGMQVTNFTMIRAGALHRANGGYLVLDAAAVLTQPQAWDGLKRALRTGCIRIESLSGALGLEGAAAPSPEPMPLDLKVILVGERQVYYMLHELDADFAELFKIAADFDDEVARTPENTARYLRWIARMAAEAALQPLDAIALARVEEHGARLAGDADRLALLPRALGDLLREADFAARQAGRSSITVADVDLALANQRRRTGRLRDQHLDAILRNDLLITRSGGHVGQINGLAVVDLAGTRYAYPVRITATVRSGEGDIIDIEREAELGGALHSKGVMILAAFLGARYTRQTPLSLSASLVFEQSYGPVEGDSASLAELCALLSALACTPIKQAFAVTGSINQYGLVQAVGGVNEKVEGFFDLCAAGGLSGEQGVLIPAANAKHLMLRDDVVAACAAGDFRIHAVSTVDQAIEILTGLSAGAPDAQGVVPEGSINYRVGAQLFEMSAVHQGLVKPPVRRHRG